MLGTAHPAHPWVSHLRDAVGEVYVGGRHRAARAAAACGVPAFPPHSGRAAGAFRRTRLAPGGGLRTRNPLHRAHVELVKRAADAAGAAILLHPVVGSTRPGDVDDFARMACYRAVLPHFAPRPALPGDLAPGDAHGRPAGGAVACADPQELRGHPFHRRPRPRQPRQPGATASPSTIPTRPSELVAENAAEIGIAVLPFEELVYREDAGVFVGRSEVPAGAPITALSGNELRRKLRDGEPLPAFSPTRRSSRSCAGGTGPGWSRASRSFSPAFPEPASRPSPGCCWRCSRRRGPAAGDAARRRHREAASPPSSASPGSTATST